MRTCVVAVLLLLGLSTLAAPVDFGPERELVPRPATGLAPGMRERARVAASDSGALVVWSDRRADVWDVYAARLDRAGAVLDDQGPVIASGVEHDVVRNSGIAGDVLWTGRAYLVAYSVHPIVYVRTVTPEGVLGEPIPIVDVEWVHAHTVRLATDGETVLLMTNSGRGAVLTLDGEKRRELNLGVMPRSEFALDLAVSNDAYGLATIATNGVAFRRIRADSEEAAQILPGSNGATTIALGSDGTSFLAVYDSKPGIVPHLRAHRVGDAAGHDLTRFASAFPTVVWRGRDYLITFSRTTNIDAMAVRASAAGEPLGEPVMFAAASPPSLPDADLRPDGTGVAAWIADHRVEVGFFDTSDAAPSNIQPISFAAPDQRYVQVAARGGDVFTTWLESKAGLHAVRLGRGPGGPAVTLDTGDAWPIDVLVEGDVVWAVWGRYSDGVLVRRYTSSLLPIDDEPLRTLLYENGPYPRHRTMRIAAGGGTLLLVTEGGENDTGVYAHVVREGNGELAVDPLFLATPYMSRRATVAWNGNEFVVAWAHSQSEWIWWMSRVAEHLVAQRIGADGVLRDAAPVTISDEPNRVFDAIESTRSGNDVALIWQTSPVGVPSIATRDTFAARVRSPEPHEISNPLGRSLRAVTTLGDQVLLLWTNDDVEYVVVSDDLDEVERGIAPIPPGDFALASAGTRPVLLYARITEEHGRVFRAFLRTTLFPRNRAVRR